MAGRKSVNRVRQEDVAQMAGVAISTVSRVFNNPNRINPQTAERVRDAAKVLGYTVKSANPMPEGNPHRTHGLLMLVVKDTADGTASQILKGAQAAALESNRSVGIMETGQSVKRSGQMLDTLTDNVDGVILATDQIDVGTIQRISRKLPLVVLNRPVEQVRSVVPNPLIGVSRTLLLLQRYNLHSIVYVSSLKDSWANRSRWESLRMLAHGMGFSIRQIGAVSPSVEGGFQAAIALEGMLPDVIIAFNDVIASGIVLRLAADGIDVPDRTSVVGFDNSLTAPVVSPALTTIRIPRAQLGQVGVQMLLGQSGSVSLNLRDARFLSSLAEHGLTARLHDSSSWLDDEKLITEIHTSLVVRGSVGAKLS